MFYETNLFIQLQKKYISIQQNIFIKLFKFPDIDTFLFNKALPQSLTLCRPFFKKQERNLETACLKQHGGPGTTFLTSAL